MRWSIRRKLLAGLCGVAVMVAAVVVSGLQATYSYRTVVKAMTEEIDELQLLAPLEKLLYELVVPGDVGGRPPDLSPRLLASRLRHAIELTRPFLDYQRAHHSYMEAKDHGEIESSSVAALARDLGELAEELQRVPSGQPAPEALVARLAEFAARLQDLQHMVRADVHKMLADARASYRGALAALVATSLTVLVLLAVLSVLYYRWVSRPVEELREGVASLADGDFDHEIRIDSRDEMQDLAEQFNAMTRRLRNVYANLEEQVAEKGKRLALSERLASVGFLGAGVAHEINNPLSSIAGYAEALQRRIEKLDDGAAGEFRDVAARHLRTICEEAFRCKEITRALLDLSRPGDRPRERLDLAQLTRDVVDMVRHVGKYRHKRLDLLADGPAPVEANPLELKQVVLNLAANGLDNVDAHGRLEVRSSTDSGQAVLEFADNGAGMSAETLGRVFELFFSLKTTGRGIGLGLSISHSIVRDHGGDIQAASDGPGQGSTFTVTLPLAGRMERKTDGH